MPTPERVIETIRAECLDPTVIQRSAASRSDAPDLCRALQPRATPSRPRPRPSMSRSVGPDAGQSARRSPTGSARWADPRVLRRRRVIESGFPIPTGSNRVVAAALLIAEPTVGKWRRRFLTGRLDGLLDEPRPGAPRTIGDAEVERVIALTLESAPSPRPSNGCSTGSHRAGVQPKGAPHPADRALAEPPTGARRSSWSTDPLFITASGGDRQRITETIWWDHHEGSHSAEALRLGKQTLCQLSYSRSGAATF